MKQYSKQYKECYESGYLDLKLTRPAKIEDQPAFAKIKFKEVNYSECGRFGGICSSSHEECRAMRRLL